MKVRTLLNINMIFMYLYTACPMQLEQAASAKWLGIEENVISES